MCRSNNKQKPYITQQLRDAQLQLETETKLLLLGKNKNQFSKKQKEQANVFCFVVSRLNF